MNRREFILEEAEAWPYALGHLGENGYSYVGETLVEETKPTVKKTVVKRVVVPTRPAPVSAAPRGYAAVGVTAAPATQVSPAEIKLQVAATDLQIQNMLRRMEQARQREAEAIANLQVLRRSPESNPGLEAEYERQKTAAARQVLALGQQAAAALRAKREIQAAPPVVTAMREPERPAYVSPLAEARPLDFESILAPALVPAFERGFPEYPLDIEVVQPSAPAIQAEEFAVAEMTAEPPSFDEPPMREAELPSFYGLTRRAEASLLEVPTGKEWFKFGLDFSEALQKKPAYAEVEYVADDQTPVQPFFTQRAPEEDEMAKELSTWQEETKKQRQAEFETVQAEKETLEARSGYGPKLKKIREAWWHVPFIEERRTGDDVIAELQANGLSYGQAVDVAYAGASVPVGQREGVILSAAAVILGQKAVASIPEKVERVAVEAVEAAPFAWEALQKRASEAVATGMKFTKPAFKKLEKAKGKVKQAAEQIQQVREQIQPILDTKLTDSDVSGSRASFGDYTTSSIDRLASEFTRRFQQLAASQGQQAPSAFELRGLAHLLASSTGLSFYSMGEGVGLSNAEKETLLRQYARELNRVMLGLVRRGARAKGRTPNELAMLRLLTSPEFSEQELENLPAVVVSNLPAGLRGLGAEAAPASGPGSALLKAGAAVLAIWVVGSLLKGSKT